jgi:tetratricopeptide (TPR) repeat protein
MEPLALAYYKMGDLATAQEEYEKITSLSSGRIYYGDIYAKSFYMLGKIYEQKGWKGKAIEHYEKFLDLWKDADADIPEAEDARKRLAGLKELNYD